MPNGLFHLATVLSRGLIAVCSALLAAMTVIVATLVFTRYIFNYSFPWAEELTRYLMIWMVMFAAPVIQYRNDNIRVEFIIQYAPSRLQGIVYLVHRVLIIGFSAILAYYGWIQALNMDITKSPTLGISMTIPFLTVPVGGVLLVLFSLLNLYDDLREIAGKPRLQTDRVEY